MSDVACQSDTHWAKELSMWYMWSVRASSSTWWWWQVSDKKDQEKGADKMLVCIHLCYCLLLAKKLVPRILPDAIRYGNWGERNPHFKFMMEIYSILPCFHTLCAERDRPPVLAKFDIPESQCFWTQDINRPSRRAWNSYLPLKVNAEPKAYEGLKRQQNIWTVFFSPEWHEWWYPPVN